MPYENAHPDLVRLMAQQACRDLVVRAAVCTDAGAWEELADLFTEDAVLLRPGADALRGRSAILASYRARPSGRISRHLISNSDVRFESVDLAVARSQVLLWSGQEEDPRGPWGRPARSRQVIGEFDDSFERKVHGWRIARRTASFVLFHDLQ